MRKNVVVFFGGKSVEHDISIITGLQTLKNISEIYNVIPIYIRRNGIWQTAENICEPAIYSNFDKLAKKVRNVTLISGKPYIAFRKNGKYSKFQAVDFALLCTHGRFGEDGGLQGMLECSSIPYSSCNIRSSAICMDKILTKDVLISHKLPNLPYLALNFNEFEKNREKVLREIVTKIKFPLILKPANLGSSIGIKICHTLEELEKSISFCAKFDRRILVEKFLEDVEEYNCACVHMGDDVKISSVVKIGKKEEIFSFKDKYLGENKREEKVERSLGQQIKKLAEKCYYAFDCFGVVRVDFLFDSKKKKLYINEINSIPGSMAFYLFKDFSFKDLTTSLIEEGLLRFQKEQYISGYDSEALEVFEKLDLAYKNKK